MKDFLRLRSMPTLSKLILFEFIFLLQKGKVNIIEYKFYSTKSHPFFEDIHSLNY